jgi:SMC interacting uncharacterized protein involved in chromosome segregation
LSQIKELYTVEQELRKVLKEQDISGEQFIQKRKERCKPILDVYSRRKDP